MLEERKEAYPEWDGYVSVAKKNKAVRQEFVKDMVCSRLNLIETLAAEVTLFVDQATLTRIF